MDVEFEDFKDLVFLWLYGFIIISALSVFYGLSRDFSLSLFIIYFYPLLGAILIFLTYKLIPNRFSQTLFAYILFFSITLTSFFGVTKIMDGSYAISSNILLFGLSFYSVSLGYILFTRRKIEIYDVLFVSNPLLIITGPIAINRKSIKYRNIKARIKYFVPYMIYGLFLLEVISVTLTPSFHLASNVDLVSSICFAIIFELFIYSNFCGLSLIIYGAFGIFGYLIPLNFKQPFSATTVMDFWKGWHRSLSEVLKRLFYKPIRSKKNLYIGVFFVFIASALWHGTSINFLLWGLLHFFTFSLTIFLVNRNITVFNIAILMFAVILGRLIFLESDTDMLISKLQFQYNGLGFFNEFFALPKQTLFGLMLIIITVFVEFFFRNHRLLIRRNYKLFRLPFFQVVFLVLILLSLSDSSGLLYPVYGQR
tara:strand:- start:435 stop:1706 length:1272 start_codon:yes stop_codon:yes gene_type:complete